VIYVTDTHPLIFQATGRAERLGKRARRIFRDSENGKHSIIVPIVVLEEAVRLVEKRVVKLAAPFRRWAEELDRSPNFHIQAYTIGVLFETIALRAIRDPADRVIVATARHLGHPLITADEVIQDGDWVETIWD
jgi:PIN domain nuclease of toxin-antitoxin system